MAKCVSERESQMHVLLSLKIDHSCLLLFGAGKRIIQMAEFILMCLQTDPLVARTF